VVDAVKAERSVVLLVKGNYVNFRREITGASPDNTRCTVVVELSGDRTYLILRLTSSTLFTVALAEPDVAEFSTALLSGDTSYVSVAHAVHGRRLLGVRAQAGEGSPPVSGSADCGPVELYLELPDGQVCEVVLDAVQATELVRHLDEGWKLITQPRLGE
jgi:hypothetical protein